MAKGQLRVRIVGDDSDLKGKLKSASKGIATFAAAGVAAAATLGAGLLKIGADFDGAFDTIRVGTGATGDALEALKDDFRQVVKDVPTDFGSAATAIADLNTRTGQTGKPLQELSKQFLELSRLTKTDLSTNIANITRLFGDWSISTEDQSATMDKLFRASQTTGIGVDRLSELMVQFGSPLRQLGLGFDFTAAMFSRFEKEGVNIETAMPGLRMALKNFAKDGREPAEALMESMQAIKDAGSAAEANQLAFEVFGVRAGPDLAAAIREGRFDLDEMMDTITNGSDTILQAAADTEDFGQKWQMLKNKVFLALEPIATRLFDALGAGLDRVVPMFESFIAQVQSGTGVGGQFRTVVEAVVGAATMFWAALQQIGLALAPLLPPLMTLGQQILAVVWPALQSIGNTIMTQVVPAFAQFLVAAQPVLTWLIETLGGALIGALKGAVKIIQGALNVIAGIFKVFTGLLTGDWSKAWQGIKQIVSGVWTAIKGAFQVWWNVGIIKVARLGLSLIKNLFKAGWNAVKGMVSSAWSSMIGAVRSGVNAVVTWVKNLRTSIRNVFSNAVGWLKSAGGGIIRGLWDGLRERWTAAWNWIKERRTAIKDFFSGAIDWLKNAGRQVMNGLWNGLKDKWGDVTGWLSNLNPANWFNDINVQKGHADKNLYPMGKQVMGGLQRGMQDGWDDVTRWLRTIDPSSMILTRQTKQQMFARDLLAAIRAGKRIEEDLSWAGMDKRWSDDAIREVINSMFYQANPGFNFGQSPGFNGLMAELLQDFISGSADTGGWRASDIPMAGGSSRGASQPVQVHLQLEARPGADSAFATWLLGQMRKGQIRFVDSAGRPVRVG